MESSSATHVHKTNIDQRNYTLKIDPPLLNSASPWATTKEDLERLYHCTYTGAVTIRTSTLEGAGHDDSIYQYTYFTLGKYANDPESELPSDIHVANDQKNGPYAAIQHHSALHTTSHSPLTLSEYLGIINEISGQRHLGTADDSGNAKKPWILSVAGDADEVGMAYALVANAAEMDEGLRLCVEIKLTCLPMRTANDSSDARESEETWMPMSMPPAYDEKSLREYLESVADAKKTYWGRMAEDNMPRMGIELPPYFYKEQFEMVGKCLRGVKGEVGKSVVDFVVCTDSLPGCLGLRKQDMDAKSTASKMNGNPHPSPHPPPFQYQCLSGPALHPLALGNVHSLRHVLDRHPETKDILIIGCGGVEDRDGFDRIRRVGAGAVGIGTALGREGVGVFGKIMGL